MEGCWRQQCSAFRYIDEHRNRKREHEMQTIDQFDKLARHIESEGNLPSMTTDRKEREVKA